jgi:hypothetical protein
MNDSQILQPVEDVWHHHCAALDEALDETIRELQNLLRLDEYHRHGHEEDNLKDTLGPFAKSNLNLSSLSEVLDKSGNNRHIQEDRLGRVKDLLERLGKIKESCHAESHEFPVVDIGEDEKTIHVEAEAHLNKLANVFCNLRMAQLEIRSKYSPAIHDPIFENFSWRLLSPAELALCPPFVIIAKLGSDFGDILRKIMSLLESRKPFKIIALRASLKKAYSPTADPTVPATMSVEMLPLAMRGVYFLQTCPAADAFRKKLFKALSSPRPTLISILAQKENEDQEALKIRAERALRTRAFPAIIYDPDKDRGFVTCFDLSANPEVEESVTFADYAISESDYEDEFTDPPHDFSATNLVPIHEFLQLVRHQRVGKLPTVAVPGDGDEPVIKVASPAIVTQTSDLMHLWKTLQEIAGEDNPHVKSTAETLRAEHGAQQKLLLENMQKDMEESQTHREQVAVASAVQQLVAQLTGVDSTEIDLQTLVAIEKQAKETD